MKLFVLILEWFFADLIIIILFRRLVGSVLVIIWRDQESSISVVVENRRLQRLLSVTEGTCRGSDAGTRPYTRGIFIGRLPDSDINLYYASATQAILLSHKTSVIKSETTFPARVASWCSAFFGIILSLL